MYSLLAPLALVSLLASSALAQVTINTPLSVVVCQPVLLAWSGGTPPYFLSILPANQPTAAAIVDFGRQDGTSFRWNADLPVGTSGFLQIRDNDGTIGQSGTFTIQTGSDTSCVGKATSATSTPAGTSTTAAGTTSTGTTLATSVTSATTRPASSTGAAAGTSGAASSSKASGTASAPAGSSSAASGASSKHAQVGVAGLVGIAAIAAFL